MADTLTAPRMAVPRMTVPLDDALPPDVDVDADADADVDADADARGANSPDLDTLDNARHSRAATPESGAREAPARRDAGRLGADRSAATSQDDVAALQTVLANEYLDAYVALCAKRSVPPCERVCMGIEDALDSGTPPTTLVVNSSGRADGDRVHDRDLRLILAPLQAAHSNFLTRLDLAFNRIGDDGAAALADFLAQDRVLRDLGLRGNDIGAVGGKALADALVPNTRLARLDVSANPLGRDFLMALATALQVNTTLRALNAASTQPGTDAVVALMTLMATRTALTWLDLSDNRTATQDDCLRHVARMLGENTTLTTLVLRKAGWDDATAEQYLAPVFAKNETLRTLDLGANAITRSGAAALARALAAQSPPRSLTALDLSHNRIQDEGARAFARLLAAPATGLARLDVAHNAITGDGLVPLAAALAANPAVAYLGVWGNRFDAPAIAAWSRLMGGAAVATTWGAGPAEAARQPPDAAAAAAAAAAAVRLRPEMTDVGFYTAHGEIFVAHVEPAIPCKIA